MNSASRLCWLMIALALMATAIIYLERQTLSIVAPILTDRYHMSNETYARIVFAFMVAYTIMNRELVFAAQKYHTELHLKIATYARSEDLRVAIGNNYVLVFNWLYGGPAGPRFLPDRFHQELIDAIITGGPDKAEAARRLKRQSLGGIQPR